MWQCFFLLLFFSSVHIHIDKFFCLTRAYIFSPADTSKPLWALSGLVVQWKDATYACPTSYVFAPPATGYDNQLLRQLLKAGQQVWLALKLSQFSIK